MTLSRTQLRKALDAMQLPMDGKMVIMGQDAALRAELEANRREWDVVCLQWNTELDDAQARISELATKLLETGTRMVELEAEVETLRQALKEAQ